MKQYACYDTGIIEESDFHSDEICFCIIKKYHIYYQEQLPRFKSDPSKIYALPFDEIPSKVYSGIGTCGLHEIVEKIEEFEVAPDQFLDSEKSAIRCLNLFDDADRYEILCVRVYGSDAKVPSGYGLLGHDITYPPCADGAFSIINDCMFVCMWHGCDEGGTAFLPYFEKLNENGLFDDADTAYRYMKYYLSFDWSERGEYCICEIFRKN